MMQEVRGDAAVTNLLTRYGRHADGDAAMGCIAGSEASLDIGPLVCSRAVTKAAPWATPCRSGAEG